LFKKHADRQSVAARIFSVLLFFIEQGKAEREILWTAANTKTEVYEQPYKKREPF